MLSDNEEKDKKHKEEMNETTDVETVEINAGELLLKVPYTSEGLKVVRAMVTFLEETKAKKAGETQPNSVASFSPVKSSPMQRIKFKKWEPIAKTRSGLIYTEVINRMLEEYKNGVEPSVETLSQIIQEMYGKHLKESSIASYASVYRRYIRENKLAIKHPLGKSKPGIKDILSIEKVREIWNLLPEKFKYKEIKALVPAHIMQSQPRIETTNFLIKEFLHNPEFECEETSPGVFSKSEVLNVIRTKHD